MVIYRHSVWLSVMQSVSERCHVQILEVSGCFRTAGPVFQDELPVVHDGSGRLLGRFRMTVWLQWSSLLSV
jgi:hypothetical protein